MEQASLMAPIPPVTQPSFLSGGTGSSTLRPKAGPGSRGGGGMASGRRGAAPHLIVVARVEVAPVLGPVALHDVLHRHQGLGCAAPLVLVRQDVEPRKHCPQPVLLTNVVRACSRQRTHEKGPSTLCSHKPWAICRCWLWSGASPALPPLPPLIPPPPQAGSSSHLCQSSPLRRWSTGQHP